MSAPAGPPPAAVRHLAIAGNPNCGKSTIFNALTGLRQKVGNYPGVTVEWKLGRFHGSHGEPLALLDLPGTYSLQPRSPDETAARDAILGRIPGLAAPDAIICVVDASNLERNLYLATQLLELGTPLVIALNMVDLAEEKGLLIDVPGLARQLGVPVIPMVASRGKGFVELRQTLSRTPLPPPPPPPPLPPPLAAAVAALAPLLAGPARFAAAEALLLLSLPEALLAERLRPIAQNAAAALRAARGRLVAAGFDPVSGPAEARYRWIQAVCDRAVVRRGSGRLEFSDRLDTVLTHRVWGWPIFLAAMGGMFVAIFAAASHPMGWIEAGFAALADLARDQLPAGDLRSLIADGIIPGVGGVTVFLPQIMILFFFLGLLEDTGYMARAAFIMDRLMARVGLHGKSFIPLLSSFACAIPGIMAARTVENPRDRLVTILVAPLMSCSARLPVYALMIAVLIPAARVPALTMGGIMLALYLLGIAVAFATAWLLKRTILRGQAPMLLLELPPYRWPAWGGIARRMVERALLFIRQAGTIILALSILLWALLSYPKPAAGQPPAASPIGQSYGGRLGRFLEPAIAPLGFDWKIGIGIIGSFAAREVFVGTMAIVYQLEDDSAAPTEPLRVALGAERRADGRPVFSPLVCVGLMVFYVLAMQCVSTSVVVWRETRDWRWPLLQFGYMTCLAYLGAFAVYQGGRLFGWQ